ncbi:MAG: sialate O-acetylesterase [Verrucomicrobiia bacterium]
MLTLAPIFNDDAVLQRDTPIPIWGRADPHTRITVSLSSYPAASTRANDDGSWLVRLPPVPAGGPHQLQATTDQGDQVVLHQILVGDVWICSGQSNMEWQLSQCDPDGTQAADAHLPNLRLLTVATAAKADPQTSINAPWLRCSPETISSFSAVAGWFGRNLQTELNVPIGLIANAWGGTRIEAWLSREALMTDSRERAGVMAYEELLYGHQKTPEKRAYPTAEDWFQAEGPEDPVNRGESDGWHTPQCNDHTWPIMDLPCRWQDHGHDFNGIFWFRRTIPLPPNWQGKSLLLELGAVDKHDFTYANGQQVGAIGWENRNSWCTPRSYTIPAHLTQQETLHLAVRVRSHLYHGGITGPARTMRLSCPELPETVLPLAGPWRYAIEQNWGIITPPDTFSTQGPGGPNAPYTLFNSRLHPLIPYAIRGFLWYQGESNADRPTDYLRQLPLLISDWRRAFGQGDLPFLIVQLASYMAPQKEPSESSWAALREAQRAALRLPGTGLAVTIDVGDATDIHPQKKKPVGERLARWALATVYGRDLLPSGPLFLNLIPEPQGKLRVTFSHATGLRTRDGGPVRSVAIADETGPFYWAQTSLEGETLLAWHPSVPRPRRLRYAWADNPEGCNLVNADDLPASPFQAELPSTC